MNNVTAAGMKTNCCSWNKPVKNTNVSFGYKVFVDSGASDPRRGSFKVSIKSEQTGKDIFNTSQLPDELKKVGPQKGFESVFDYINGLSSRINESIKLAGDKIANLKGDDKLLSGVLINAPAYVIGGILAPIIPNLKDHLGQSLTNADFSEIKIDAPKNPVNFRIMATNDMHGAAAGVAKILKDRGMLQEGFYGVICMTGGGMGVVDIKVKNGFLEIEGQESGHNQFIKQGKAKSLESTAASVSSLITNYCLNLKMKSKTIKELINQGDAKIVTNALISGSAEEKQAAEKAVDKYIDALAQEFSRKVVMGANLIILSGPLFNGIKNALTNKTGNPDELKERLIKAIKSHIPETGPGNIMAQIHNFDVDLNMNIPDNTVGGALLLDSAQFIGKDVRGNWLNIPITEIN